MRIGCGPICLIALVAASSDQESDQERGANKPLAAPLPYTHLLTDLISQLREKLFRIFHSRS
jgi:hypothetical protein